MNLPTHDTEELRVKIAAIITDVTSAMMSIIGDPDTQPDEVHPKRLELCRSALNEAMQLITAREQVIREEAEREGQVKGLRRGYELVNDVRYKKRDITGVFRQLIDECSAVEVEIEMAALHPTNNQQDKEVV